MMFRQILLSKLFIECQAQKSVKNLSSKSVKTLTSKVVKDLHEVKRVEKVKEKKKELHRAILSSYLNVCVHSGQINRAFNFLLRYKAKSTKYFSSKNALETTHFNTVIRGWARLGSIEQVRETRSHMAIRNIKANIETQTLTLLALAKQKKPDMGYVTKILSDMQSGGVDPKKIFQPIYLNPTERNMVINLVKRIIHDFEDEFYNLPMVYNCDLLQTLTEVENQNYSPLGDKRLDSIDSWIREQRLLESYSSVPIKSIAIQRISHNRVSQASKMWRKAIKIWSDNFMSVLEKDLDAMQNQYADDDRVHLYPYLCSVDKKYLIDLLLDELEARANSQKFSPQTNYLHFDLGRKVMVRYLRDRAQKDGSYGELQKLYDSYVLSYCSNPELMSRINSRLYLQKQACDTKNYSIYTDRQRELSRWPRHIISSVGKYLYSILLREAKFNPSFLKPLSDDPERLACAFYTVYIQMDSSHRVKEEFRAHPSFTQFYEEGCRSNLKFDYSYLPSLAPPMPWISTDIGGYLTSTVDLVRQPELTQAEIFGKVASQELYPTLDSLNALGLCPWKVNERILDLAISIFQNGGDEELAIPLDETTLGKGPEYIDAAACLEEKRLHKRKRFEFKQRKREMYALWCECLYRLSIANHYRSRILWYPHNLDFRGRTYPVPPHFNHLGGDMARSLLLFYKGRPLGEKGLDWLKIHVINLTGSKKKANLQQRLDYANSILPEILDSADQPLQGRGWWKKSEEPWQTLACCIEIYNAMKFGSSEEYICHFPVHQDGSCNGLQHYAALGRDLEGGRSVNLLPLGSPQDVYSKVVELVERSRDEDAQNGLEVAILLRGRISRKLIKQTVMTIVYGVTRYGAREQVSGQLRDLKDFPQQKISIASSYVVGKVFQSIGTLFEASQKIQEWLKLCAFTIGVHYNQPVRWSTPLGFPVTQPYHKPSKLGTRVVSSESTIEANQHTLYSDISSRPNIAKQRSAFPPNYIHSLDSTHMMLTSLHCQNHGITFVSVHDCFWTHPSTVDRMNRICREQFISLHSIPLIEQLSDQFVSYYLVDTNTVKGMKLSNDRKLAKAYEAYKKTDNDKTADRADEDPESRPLLDPKVIFKSTPEIGQLDIKQVLKSTYFFS